MWELFSSKKKKLYILENPISNARAKDVEEEVRNEHQHHVNDDEQTTCVMLASDTTKRLMSSLKCRSVEVINNPARLGSNHREVNCINYK